MKKIARILLLAFVEYFFCTTQAYASTTDFAFVPELLSSAYNEALSPVFSALSMDSSTVSLVESYAKVNYYTKEGSTLVYTNEDQTIFFFFGATDKYSEADNVMFYTSLKDSNPVKNIPQIAFAFAFCSLEDECDFNDFGRWVNDATDESTFFSTSFTGYYSLTPQDNSSITLIKS